MCGTGKPIFAPTPTLAPTTKCAFSQGTCSTAPGSGRVPVMPDVSVLAEVTISMNANGFIGSATAHALAIFEYITLIEKSEEGARPITRSMLGPTGSTRGTG